MAIASQLVLQALMLVVLIALLAILIVKHAQAQQLTVSPALHHLFFPRPILVYRAVTRAMYP